MFLIKRKKAKISKEDVAVVVVSNQDIIVLGTFCFTGMQKGDFFVKDTATVDITSIVEGSITAFNCAINGLVKGDVFCVNNLWLGSSAVIEGSIMAKKAILETGCKVNGTVVLAPKVEVSTLAARIREAEGIVVNKKTLWMPEVFTEETDIPPKRVSMPDTKTLAKEQKSINVQKAELPFAQAVDNDDDWW